MTNQQQLEDLAQKIMQATPGLGWHSAWIKAVRLTNAMEDVGNGLVECD